MKKIILTTLIASFTLSLFAQNLNKVKDMLKNNELDKAKAGIDQLLTNPKQQKNAEVWFTKAKIYGAIATNDQFKTLVPDGRADAFEAIKKAVELDKNETTTFLTLDNYKPVYDLYGGYFDQAAAQYNAEKYEDALSNFKKSSAVGEYIFSQGWGLAKLDTTLVYYSALAAMNAKKEDEAATAFQKLADAKIGTKPEHVTIYRFLAKYYLDKKDIPNMQKYIKQGVELYPKDDYLPLVEFDYLRNQGDKKAIYAKYEELIKSNPENFDMIVDYANELFNETHVSDVKDRPADYNDRIVKIEGLYKQALALKPDALEANLNLAKHYFNQALFLEEDANKIKSTKPEDVKKKDEMKAQVVALCDKAIPPFEVVFNALDSKETLKLSEKSEYKSACNNLAYCYDRKKDKAKSDFYQKKYDEADKK
ncbi:MAG: tetratricopeptide repeat protein [Agriterribacter sp.]